MKNQEKLKLGKYFQYIEFKHCGERKKSGKKVSTSVSTWSCEAQLTSIKSGKKGSLFIMDVDHLDFEIADKTRFSTTIKGCDTQVWKDDGQVYAMVF